MDHKGPIREAASRELEGQRPSVLDICPIRPLLARARDPKGTVTFTSHSGEPRRDAFRADALIQTRESHRPVASRSVAAHKIAAAHYAGPENHIRSVISTPVLSGFVCLLGSPASKYYTQHPFSSKQGCRRETDGCAYSRVTASSKYLPTAPSPLACTAC